MLNIEQENDLVALHKALMAVRFAGSDMDPALRGSANLSRIHHEVLDELTGLLNRAGKLGSAENWRDWRQLSNRHEEVNQAILYLQQFWDVSRPDAFKQRVLVLQLSPFIFESAEIDAIQAHLDGGITTGQA